jgi:hypothetical protein
MPLYRRTYSWGETDLNQGPGSSSRSRRAPLWFRGTPRLIPIAVMSAGNCIDQDAVKIIDTPHPENPI